MVHAPPPGTQVGVGEGVGHGSVDVVQVVVVLARCRLLSVKRLRRWICASSAQASLARSGAGESDSPLVILSMEPSARYSMLTVAEAPTARAKAAAMTADLMMD